MKKKIILYTLASAICFFTLAGCGKKSEDVTEVTTGDTSSLESEDQDFKQFGYDTYQSIISFVQQNKAEGWASASPMEMWLPSELADTTRNFGYLINDLDNDGTDDLLIGEQCEGEIPVKIYAVFTVNSNGIVEELYRPGFSDYMYLNNENTYIAVSESSDTSSESDPDEENMESLLPEDQRESYRAQREAEKASEDADEASREAAFQSEQAEILESEMAALTEEADETEESQETSGEEESLTVSVDPSLSSGAYKLENGAFSSVDMPTDLSALLYTLNPF